jgi:hypothetical protein
MTDKQSDAPLNTDARQDELPPQERQVIQPERLEDPVTTRNADPAAMSEAERNRRLTETYERPLNEQ